jgi:hypothetical protein
MRKKPWPWMAMSNLLPVGCSSPCLKILSELAISAPLPICRPVGDMVAAAVGAPGSLSVS